MEKYQWTPFMNILTENPSFLLINKSFFSSMYKDNISKETCKKFTFVNVYIS